jgi:threonine synthase
VSEIYREDKSVLTRYADRLGGVSLIDLEAVSQREGARILRLDVYRGRSLYLLDLSTLSTTGTFKDWVAAYSVARARAAGYTRVVFQSSGNTANALTAYAARAGIASLGLFPPASRVRIRRSVDQMLHKFLEIDASEAEIKRVLQEISQCTGVPALPSLADQYEGNKLRAYFLADAEAETGVHWNWHVQALSSAYGPLGFYRGLAEIGRSQSAWPRFLGIQQQAVHPYVHALGAQTCSADVGEFDMLEPTLFRRTLSDALIDEVGDLCGITDGRIRMLPNREFLTREKEAVDQLEEVGVHLCRYADGAVRERAGIYSLLGAFSAIDDGTIPRGDNVLVVHTGGAGYCHADPHLPDHIAGPDTALADAIELLGALSG